MRGTAMLLQLYAERMVRQQREKQELVAAEQSIGMQPGATAPAPGRRRSSLGAGRTGGGGRGAASPPAPAASHTVDDFMRAAEMLGVADVVIAPLVRKQAAARVHKAAVGSPRKGPPPSALLPDAPPPTEDWMAEFRRLARVVRNDTLGAPPDESPRARSARGGGGATQRTATGSGTARGTAQLAQTQQQAPHPPAAAAPSVRASAAGSRRGRAMTIATMNAIPQPPLTQEQASAAGSGGEPWS